MKKRLSNIIALVITMAILLLTLGITISAVSALTEEALPDAMEEIMANLGTDSESTKNYMIGEKIIADDDGYVGAVELSVFFDEDNFDVQPGYHGTPIILYTVNTRIERIGKDSDTKIIKSMLDRGYVVIVADYLNSEKAVSPILDNSASMLRTKMRLGEYLTSSIFPAGDYYELHLCPAGYDVLLDQIFWSADKHGAEGTLEKIVEIWNGDFRGAKGSKNIIWATGTTPDTRKKVATANDGSEPVWYADAECTVVDNENGLYTKVKYTVAETIYDCVNPDGSMVCLDLYIHVVYPTVDESSSAVPVVIQANSSSYPTTSVTTLDDRRAISGGCLFNGYAQVIYDYFYTPMARGDSWTYFSGETSAGAVTGDNLTYSVHVYNDKLIVTSAMRYLRYLTLSTPDTYKFDINGFAVYGNSKGGYISFLGEKYLQSALVDESYNSTLEYEQAIDKALASITPLRYLDGHHGETRYQAGRTEDVTDEATGFTIRAGELQPWITYDGDEIISGAQLTYVANGSESENVSDGHSPMIVTIHLNDSYNAAYGESNRFANMVRVMNIPSFAVEVPLGHTMTYGPDVDFGIDVYDAIFKFFGYYLKDDAISVLHVTPQNDEGGVNLTDKITVQFAGAVTAEEIEKVTVSGGGKTLNGTWNSECGGTEWIFTPTDMKGGVKYTVTVPADLKGDNGVAMGKAYTSEFYTELDSADFADINFVDTENGRFIDLTAPTSLTDIYNGYAIRFFVNNNAANIAELYAVDPADYDSNGATAEKGALVGKVNLRGAGSYEIDVTDYIAERAGERVVFLLCQAKTANTVTVYENDYSETMGTLSKDSYVKFDLDSTAFDGNSALALSVIPTTRYKNGHTYYQGVNTAFTIKNILGENITADDLGRQFVFRIKVYDTVSRVVQVKFDTNTDRLNYGVRDYDFSIINVRTKANEWITVELPYTVYDADYGLVGQNRQKSVTVRIGSTGDTEIPVYFDDATVTEYITDMELGSVTLAKTYDGSIPYKAPESDKPLALYNGTELVGEYTAWNSALNAYKAGYTLKLRSDYTLTDSDVFSGFGTLSAAKNSDGEHIFNIDLNGYAIKSDNSKNSLLWLKNSSANIPETTINIYNGAIFLNKTPLVSYESSSGAGAGKSFDINFADVYVGLIEGANITQAISSDTITSGSLTNVDISFVGCTLDFPDDLHAKDVIELLPKGAGDLKLHYTLDGGIIRLSTQKFVTVQNDATVSEFIDDVTGSYTKLILPASKTPDTTSYLREDGYSVYVAGESSDGFVTCVLFKSENSTKYGIIDENYIDSEKYPWLVFSGGIFRGGYASLKDASKAAVAFVSGEDNASASAQVLLRRDAENSLKDESFVSLNSIAGNMILDLGGNTFTRVQSFLYFKADTGSAPYTSSITVTNGTILTTGGSIVSFQTATNQVVAKNFDITFDKVTFGLSATPADATKTSMNFIVEAYNTENVLSSNASVTFNDCVIDLGTNIDKYTGLTSLTVFKTYDKYNRTNVALAVNGGYVSAKDFSKVTFANMNSSNDALVMGKGSDGKYMSAATVEGGIAPKGSFIDSDGATREFTLVSGSTTKYELTVNKLVTEYGTIPTDKADVNAYPFAVFYDGKFVGAYSAWATSDDAEGASALGDAKRKISGAAGAGKTATILLRRDYYATDTDIYYNLSQVGGTLQIDLGGYSFYVGKNDMFYAEGKLTSNVAHLSTISVKNGKILNNGAGAIVGMRSKDALTSAHDKKFSFIFDGVTFALTASNTAGRPIINSPSSGGYSCKFDYSFNGCTFDYATVAPGVAVTLFYLERNATDTNQASVSINGGSFYFNSFSNVTFSRTVSKSSFILAKGSDGKYPAINTPSELAPNKTVFNTAEGKAVFMEESDDGVVSIYRLMTIPYAENANISSMADSFFSVIDNPFVVIFDGAYTACSDWKNALETAKSKVHGEGGIGKNVQIVLRRDYSYVHGVYYNLSQFGGKLTVDLLGFTFFINENDMFYAEAKLTDGKDQLTEILVKNGYIMNAGAGSVVDLRSKDTLTSSHNKKFVFTFEDITFGITSTNSASKPIVDSVSSSAYSCEFAFDFNNCVFDYASVAPSKTLTLFAPERNGGDTNRVSVTVNGGYVLVGSMDKIVFFGTMGANDSFKFARLVGGEYTRLVLPDGAKAPTAEYNGLKFVKESSDGTTATYVLTPKAAIGIDFAPLASVTLDSNLIFNIYIPEGNRITAVTLNGKTVELGTARDGYYLVSTELSAEEGAKILTLVVTLNIDGISVNGTFTFSTVKYVEKLLDTAGVTETEKTLAKDMLAYVKSAYSYFDSADKATVAEEINAVIGNYDKAFSKVEGAGADADDIIAGVTFVLESTPAIRFYLPEGASLNGYSFKIGNTALEIADSGIETAGDCAGLTYADISLYAYRMIETITIANGTNTATYHINEYYDGMDKSDTALVDIVEKFYNYCKSASEYRNSVLCV